MPSGLRALRVTLVAIGLGAAASLLASCWNGLVTPSTTSVPVPTSSSVSVTTSTVPWYVAAGYVRASTAEVRAFVAKATSNNQRFTATYRDLDTVEPGPSTFFYAQQPQGRLTSGTTGWVPHGPGDFIFVSRRGGATLRFIQRDRGDYLCVQSRSTGPWSCEGPNMHVRSIGDFWMTSSFDQQAYLGSHIPPPLSAGPIWIRHERLKGLGVTCLRYFSGGVVTWCATPVGVTAFVSAPTVVSVEIVSLSGNVPMTDFSVPTTPIPWHSYSWVWPGDLQVFLARDVPWLRRAVPAG